MSNAFENWEQVDAFQKENGGIEQLRMMLAQGTLRDTRKSVVEHYLRGHDAAEELAKERRRAAEREEQAREALRLAERSAAASERSADATEVAAEASKQSARYAMWAAYAAGIAALIPFLQFLLELWNKAHNK